MNDRAIPLALSFITIASFGILIPWLGFYWDDWPVIYMIKTQGVTGFWNFYQYDRPFSAWTYILFAPLLGSSPLVWQIFTLALRGLTAIFVWASLREIWPRKSQQVFWVAVLFAVCPIFTQQFVAVAYSQHWLCYLLFFCSVYFMLRALSDPGYFYLFTALALITSLVQLLTMEYFLGLELLRPVVLWLYFLERESGASLRHLFKRVVTAGWIYIVSLGAYILWRTFFLRLAAVDPNRPRLLEKLIDRPVAGALDLAQKMIQDFIYLVTSWVVAVDPAKIDLHRTFSIGVLFIAVVVAALFGLVINRYKPASEEVGDDRWHSHAMILGGLALIFGTLPVWMIDRQVSVGPLGSRFSLAALFGVSLLFVGFLEWLSPRSKVKATVICILVAVAIHTNLYTAKDFQQSWEKQKTFYWQLFWRAPYIQPGTAFISNGEIFQYVGLYSTSMGISLIYPVGDTPQKLPYWFFSYWERLYKFPDKIIAGTVLEGGIRNYSFDGDSKDALLLDFSPELNRCLHFFSLQDENDPDLPEAMKKILSISNLSRIERESSDGWKPPAAIFGAEPKHTWCYYLEKAELASQYQDWQEVVRLMDEAKKQGFSAADMKEYLPLLYAYLKTGRIEPARTLSLQMARLSNNIDDRVCKAWLDTSDINSDAEFNSAFENIRQKSGCFD